MHPGPRENASQRADDGLGLRGAEGLRHEHALWHDHAVHVGVEQCGARIGTVGERAHVEIATPARVERCLQVRSAPLVLRR